MSLLHAMAFFCGICFTGLGWAHSSGLSSPNMQADIKKVKDYFSQDSKMSKKKWFGKPLFLDIDDLELKESEKNLLMGEMLKVSHNILSNLLNHTKEHEFRMTILAIRGRVEELQKNYFPGIKHNVQKLLQALQAIKVNEFKTQLQALHELMKVYDKAYNLGNEKNKRRRRRRQVHQRRMTQLL